MQKGDVHDQTIEPRVLTQRLLLSQSLSQIIGVEFRKGITPRIRGAERAALERKFGVLRANETK
jgi:hypothetical protein